MKKKIIIFGSLLAVFLMLMIPNVSAIQYNLIKKDATQYRVNISKEELKNAILKKIQYLEKPFSLCINWTDPDGPLEGGLDDLTDVYHLLLGFIACGLFFWVLKTHISVYNTEKFQNTPKFIRIPLFLYEYIGTSYFMLINFGEAFDLIDETPSDGR